MATDIFKKASRKKLRFATPAGNLSTEQLWDLHLTDLDSLAVSLEEKAKQSGRKSFLETPKVENETDQLRFEIVLDILQTKQKDAETAAKTAETKARNQKIMALIQEKKEGKLQELSIEELEKMLQ